MSQRVKAKEEKKKFRTIQMTIISLLPTYKLSHIREREEEMSLYKLEERLLLLPIGSSIKDPLGL